MEREAKRRPSALTVFLLALTTFVLSVFAVLFVLFGSCGESGGPGGVEFCSAMEHGGTLAAVFGPPALIILVGLVKSTYRLLYGAFGVMMALLLLVAITFAVVYS